MTTAKTQFSGSPTNSEAVFQELEALALKAADSLRKPLTTAKLPNYRNFLNMMYYYTLPSEETLLRASEVSETEDLREYFKHMAKEERGHYVLAQEDLRALDTEPSAETPKEITAFTDTVDEILGQSIYAYLGAIYLFENIAKHLQEEGRAFLAGLDLNKKQTRWLSVHLEADLEHGEEIKEACEKHIAHADEILAGANKIYGPWSDVFSEAFGGSY